MSEPISDLAQLHATLSPEVAKEVRLAAAGLDPAQVETVVSLVLQYGPGIWKAVTSLFHLTPKS